MSYESPIEMFYDDTIQNMANQIREETDNKIVCEVKMQCGVNIDKYELAKALKYDRDQYNKGYHDAMNDARATGEWTFCEGVTTQGFLKCSICEWSDFRKAHFNYCPNCGAKMKGKEK
jgi:membrane protease subunit (stomatin/prohibitin family)